MAAAKTKQAIVMRKTILYTLAIPRQDEHKQQHKTIVEEGTTPRERRGRTLNLRAINDTRGEKFHMYETYGIIQVLVSMRRTLHEQDKV